MEVSNKPSSSTQAAPKNIAVQLQYPSGQTPVATFRKSDNGKQVTYEVHNMSKSGKNYLGLFDVTEPQKSYVGYATHNMDEDGLNVGYIATQEQYRGKRLTPLVFYCLALLAESKSPDTTILVLHPDPNVAAVWTMAGFPFQQAVDELLAKYRAADMIDKEGYVKGGSKSVEEILVRNLQEKADAEARFAKYDTPSPTASNTRNV